MTEGERLGGTYSEYWRAYTEPGEGDLSSKKEWSQTSLSAGIVQAALNSLRRSLGATHLIVALQTPSRQLYAVSEPVEWNGLRVELIGASKTSDDVAQELVAELRDRSREALCLCVLPRSFGQLDVLVSASERWLNYATLFLFPDDLDALARGDWEMEELVEYKSYRCQVLEKPAPETQYDTRLVAEFRSQYHSQPPPFSPASEVIAGYPDDHQAWAEHPSRDRAVRALKGGRSCLLIGASASGKTILALEIAQKGVTEGMAIRYLNLGTLSSAVPFCFWQLLGSTKASEQVVHIVDDLQSNPQGARYLAHIVNLSRRASNSLPVLLVGISWPDFAESAAQFIEDCLPVYVRAKDVRQSLISAYSRSGDLRASGETFDSIKDDLQLLRIYLDVQNNDMGASAPSLPEVAKSYWERRVAGFRLSVPDARRAVLAVATLGRYDVLVPRSFVQHVAQVSSGVVDVLLRAGLLRVSRTLLTLGHRSLAALMADWLSGQGVWGEFKRKSGLEDPFALVRDYLRAVSPTLALETLRALQARAGFKESGKLNSRTAALVSTWKAFNALLERIEHQQSADPQWGSGPASIMFVVQSFAEIGRAEDALASMQFLRANYTVDSGGRLDIHTAAFSTSNDFQQIADAMKEQDESFGDSPLPQGWVKAESIDIERFHRAWLSGVLLCAEGAFRGAPSPELDRLAEAVMLERLSSGAYYPERAVWPTARVCMGLAACGKSVHTNASLKGSVDWLLTERERGGACDNGLWQSGTGRWNSDLEVSAMAILACVACGVDPDDDRLASAKKYLISQSDQWMIPGHELEGALAGEAFLDGGGAWDEIAGQMQRLSEWAQGEAFWRTATYNASQSFDQSCRVAQTAAHLVAIGWSAIRAELPVLLQALDMPERHGLWRASTQPRDAPSKPSPSVETVGQEDPSVLGDNAGAVNALEHLETLRLADLAVVGRYSRFDGKTRNQLKDWKVRIIQNFVAKSCAHENFLIWAAPGSGKSFFVTEIAAHELPKIQFIELNLAKQSQAEFCSRLADLDRSSEPALCMVDEIDARKDETWPYEILFSHLDRNLSPDYSFVWILIGSSRAGKNGMIQEMRQRSKGLDLLDRLPVDRRFEIPPMCLEDRAVIFAANVREAGITRGQRVKEIEKFALYYVLATGDFASPRQLRDLAYSAVGRMSSTDDRLHYDNLFAVGERRNQQFWGHHQTAARRLADLYVSL